MKGRPLGAWREEVFTWLVARASISFGLAALVVLALSARPPRPRPAEPVRVTLSWESAGNLLVLTARSDKQGTGYIDRWSVTPWLALACATVLDEPSGDQARYVSSARASASALALDTTYTFSYAIVMKAGEKSWAGSGSVAITVALAGGLPQPDTAGRIG